LRLYIYGTWLSNVEVRTRAAAAIKTKSNKLQNKSRDFSGSFSTFKFLSESAPKMSSCDSEFRFPIPKDLGPGLSTCNIIIKAPNKIDDEKLNIISQRLSEKSSNLFKKETDQNPDKKSFKDKEFDKYGKLVIFPTNFKSNDW